MTRTLLPVLRPALNMRDVIKQLILLEDHLFNKKKRCADCIRKHFLTIEALAEECVTLCKPKAVLEIAEKLAERTRALHLSWEKNRNLPHASTFIASRLRRMRKDLMAKHSALPLNRVPSNEEAEVRAITNAIAKLRVNKTEPRSPVRRSSRNTPRKSPRKPFKRVGVKRRTTWR
jgi:hypothetical protein